VWWTETRPAEGGRTVVVRRDAAGTVSDVLPAGWNARTRVHEYGGTAWLALPGVHSPYPDDITAHEIRVGLRWDIR
jgi:hypothetical protein